MAFKSKITTDFARLLAGASAVALFAFLLRYIGMSHEPTWDELYHVLAARSWAENGTFAIADGEYTRAALFTRLIGIVTGWSDGSLDAIRLFCITIGTLLVLAVFLSVCALVGRAEAYVVERSSSGLGEGEPDDHRNDPTRQAANADGRPIRSEPHEQNRNHCEPQYGAAVAHDRSQSRGR